MSILCQGGIRGCQLFISVLQPREPNTAKEKGRHGCHQVQALLFKDIQPLSDAWFLSKQLVPRCSPRCVDLSSVP